MDDFRTSVSILDRECVQARKSKGNNTVTVKFQIKIGGNRMKKKLIALMLSAAMTAGMLAGCGSTSTTGSTDANAGAADTGAAKRKKTHLRTQALPQERR